MHLLKAIISFRKKRLAAQTNWPYIYIIEIGKIISSANIPLEKLAQQANSGETITTRKLYIRPRSLIPGSISAGTNVPI